jgi:hypothetical protein
VSPASVQEIYFKSCPTSFLLAKATNLRPLPHPARRRRCARSHFRHGQRKTIAHKCHSGTLRQNRRAQPWAKWPHRTIRGFGHRYGSIVATYPLLVPAVYTPRSPGSATEEVGAIAKSCEICALGSSQPKMSQGSVTENHVQPIRYF